MSLIRFTDESTCSAAEMCQNPVSVPLNIASTQCYHLDTQAFTNSITCQIEIAFVTTQKEIFQTLVPHKTYYIAMLSHT